MINQIKSRRKQKILLLLEAGTSLSFTRSYNKQRRIVRTIPKDWKHINKYFLWKAAQEFKHDRLVKWHENKSGVVTVTLTEYGIRTIKQFDPNNMTIPRPIRWDQRWRIVIYDIPHKKRSGSNAIRSKLRELGFKEWQKSVFIHPFPCRDQIDLVIELFDLRPYVRYAEVINPTNESELKLAFGLY